MASSFTCSADSGFHRPGEALGCRQCAGDHSRARCICGGSVAGPWSEQHRSKALPYLQTLLGFWHRS